MSKKILLVALLGCVDIHCRPRLLWKLAEICRASKNRSLERPCLAACNCITSLPTTIFFLYLLKLKCVPYFPLNKYVFDYACWLGLHFEYSLHLSAFMQFAFLNVAIKFVHFILTSKLRVTLGSNDSHAINLICRIIRNLDRHIVEWVQSCWQWSGYCIEDCQESNKLNPRSVFPQQEDHHKEKGSFLPMNRGCKWLTIQVLRSTCARLSRSRVIFGTHIFSK